MEDDCTLLFGLSHVMRVYVWYNTSNNVHHKICILVLLWPNNRLICER